MKTDSTQLQVKLLDLVEKMSEEKRQYYKDDSFFSHHPHEYGPLTPNIADRAGITIARALYHLTKMSERGIITKHKSYAGCTCRWYRDNK